MPYLVAADLPTEPAGARFRTQLGRPGILQLPGAHNGMAALQARATWRMKKQTSSTVMTPRSGRPIEAVMAAPER